MAVQDFSTATVVAAVKRRAALPTVQPRFSDANIVAFADEEMRNVIVPLVMSIVEEFFVTSVDYAVTPTTFTFAVPPRAIGNKLTDVNALDIGSTREIEMVQLAPHAIARYYGGLYPSGGYSRGYILRANKIVIAPDPTDSLTIRVYFYRRPNMLVQVSQAAKISAINTITGVVTCTSVPSAWVVGDRLDAIDGQPTFEVLFEGEPILAKAGFDITITAAKAALLFVGGSLTLQGEAVVPAQIPYEGHSLIIEAAVKKIAESLGDTALLKNSTASYEQLKSSFLMAISPRVDRAPKKVVSRGGNCWDYQ